MEEEYCSIHSGEDIDAAVSKVQDTEQTPTPNSSNLVTSGGVAAALAGKAPSVHTHTKSQITDFPANELPEVSSSDNGKVLGVVNGEWAKTEPPAAPVSSVAGKTGAVTLAKGDVGLGNVDNTSDLDKPVSTATAAAIAGHYVTAGQYSGTTLGTAATAEGAAATASGDYAHAEGYYAHATGENSHSEGYGTTASGDESHAEGNDTVASGDRAHAEGYVTEASGDNSHAEGFNTVASGDASHAEGSWTTASGPDSHAEGFKTVANHEAQHVFGQYNLADDSPFPPSMQGNYVEIVGNGTGNNDRSNARTLDWDGNEVLAGKLTLGAGPTNAMDAATKQYVDAHSGGGGTYTAGDGIVIEDGEISLPTVFYDYLLRETYEAPVLTLTMSGVGGAHEIGDALTISSITHRETNPENVKPNTLKFYRGSTEVQSLTPTATNETVALDDPISEAGSSAGSVTYALQCEDTMGAQKSSSVTATWNRYVYTKVGSPNTVPTAASDCVKQASLASFASNGATFSYSVGTCIWMLTTNQNAVIQTNVLGEWAGANMHSGGSVSFTQANGTTATYYAFRTDAFVAAGSAKYRITNP